MKFLILVAGTNEPSNSDTLANAFMQGIEQLAGADVTKIRLKDLRIDHFTLDFYQPECRQEEDFCKVQHHIESSEGVVFATPVWNFGVPAHLKNLIDRMGSFALDASRAKGTLNGKPFFLLFTGGAPDAAWKGLQRRTTSFLPTAIKYFGGTVIGMDYEGRCTKGKGRFGLVVDERPETIARVREKGAAFASVVKTFAETGKLPMRQAALKQIYSWGQAVVKKLT